MPDLTSELKHEHSRITETLRKVLDLGINSDEGKELLYTAKSYLLAHLEKEDMNLYPVLWEMAKTNDNLKDMLNLYASDMETISKMALEFFNKYTSGGDTEQFENDYKQLFVRLNKRIIKEETVIYKIYDEILFP